MIVVQFVPAGMTHSNVLLQLYALLKFKLLIKFANVLFLLGCEFYNGVMLLKPPKLVNFETLSAFQL